MNAGFTLMNGEMLQVKKNEILNFEIMIRTIITPHQRSISIDIPEDYVGKEIEIIAFVLAEIKQEKGKTLTHFASENVLAKDWLTPEEDKAWQNL